MKNILVNTTDKREALKNVAQCVMQYTEVKRHHNGKGRHYTYAADVEAIAGAARQLAELVLEQLEQ